MRLFFLILFTLVVSCGSQFFEPPPEPPDFETCTTGKKHFGLLITKSILPVPVFGRQEARLYTSKPEFWDEFEGSIHLKDIKWNVNWVKRVKIEINQFTIAQYEDDKWTISSTLDLAPFFKEKEGDSTRLGFDIKLEGDGLKPAREFVIEVDAEFYFCGKNQDLMFNLE